jgi:DNA-binding beta-propeller fold protein YncE
VVDYDDDLVDEFTLNGTPVAQWGGTGSGNGQFDDPWGVAVNAAGTTVYVADWGNDRVEAFGSSGNYLTQWGSEGTAGNGTFQSPAGVAVDSAGRVYVTDYASQLVQVFNSQGGWLYQWSTAGALQGAGFIAIDNSTGLVYVSDAEDLVAVYNELGVFQGMLGSVFSYPEGVAAANGTVYVAEQGANRVEQFGPCLASPTATFTPTLTVTFTTTPSPTSTSPTTPTSTASWTPTSTPTLSPTVTATWTPTLSPTLTATFTETTTPTEGCHDPVFYPNPVLGGNTLSLHFPPCEQGREVRVKIFTLAFRKVLDLDIQQVPIGTDLNLQLRDNWGVPLANGLYYLVIDKPETGARSIGKLLILR